MARALGLSRAGALAGLGAFIALACGSETIALLPDQDPPDAGGGRDTAGSAGQSSAGSAGAPTGGQAGLGNQTGGASTTSAGSAACGGACAGGGFAGLGNGCLYTPSCTPCGNEGQCPDQWHCSKQFGCLPNCERSEECVDGKICDADLKTCVQCSFDEHCDDDQDPDTHYCKLGRCVECIDHWQCTEGQRKLCGVSHRCVECVVDDDCALNEHCKDGRCE